MLSFTNFKKNILINDKHEKRCTHVTFILLHSIPTQRTLLKLQKKKKTIYALQTFAPLSHSKFIIFFGNTLTLQKRTRRRNGSNRIKLIIQPRHHVTSYVSGVVMFRSCSAVEMLTFCRFFFLRLTFVKYFFFLF